MEAGDKVADRVQLELHGSRLLFDVLKQRQPLEVTEKSRLASRRREDKKEGVSTGKEGEKRQMRQESAFSL